MDVTGLLVDVVDRMVVAAPAIPPPQTPPGLGAAANKVLSWLRWAVPIAGLAAAMAGLSLWAVGSSSSDYRQAGKGKKAVAAGALVAIISGVLPLIWGGLTSTA